MKMRKLLTMTLAAAVAISSMSISAFAAEYTDVKEGDDCYNAVSFLSELGVVSGYEEKNDFKPNNKITRAEFTKLVIDMRGDSGVAQAEEKKGADTIFSDVKADHWASGYITVAVSDGIIAGMGDGTFAPEKNVTYAQAMKMLVCADGYEQWAKNKSGRENVYPTSYMYYANLLKIADGVTASLDDDITRAQAACMIYNAIQAPICVSTGMLSYDKFGNAVEELAMKDGKGDDFQSLLTVIHNVYTAQGHVKGENFVITSAKNFGNEEYKKETEIKNIMIPEKYKKNTKDATAFIRENEDGDGYELIYMY